MRRPRTERMQSIRDRMDRRKMRVLASDPIDFRPLPMSAVFWRDVEMMHLRARQSAAYVPREQRDMDKGWA